MSFLAANPADCHQLSPCLVKRLSRAFRRATTVANYTLLAADMPTRITLRLRRTSVANVQMKTLLWRVSAVMYPVFCSVTASGPFRRPAALGLLLRIPRPFGVSVPPKTSLQTTAKNAAQTSFGPLPESSSSALGSRAHSLGSSQCDPINNGKIQQTETLLCTRTK
jgi:hypothetical protein